MSFLIAVLLLALELSLSEALKCPCSPAKECFLQGNLYSRRRIRLEPSASGSGEKVMHVQLALKIKDWASYSFTVFGNETSIDSTWLPTRFDSRIAERLPPDITAVSHYVDAEQKKSRIVIDLEFAEVNMLLNSTFEIRVFSVYHRGCNQLIPLIPAPTTMINFDCRYVRGQPCSAKLLPNCDLTPAFSVRVSDSSQKGKDVRVSFEFSDEQRRALATAEYLIAAAGECSGNAKDIFRGKCTLDVGTATISRLCVPGRLCSGNKSVAAELALDAVSSAQIGVLMCAVFDRRYELSRVVASHNLTLAQQLLVGEPIRSAMNPLSSKPLTGLIAILGILLLLLCIALLYKIVKQKFFVLRKKKKLKDPWEITPNLLDICYDKCLGFGPNSRVYTGFIHSKDEVDDDDPLLMEKANKVAVKQLANDSDALVCSRFRAEISLRKLIHRHANIVNLIGVCTCPEGQNIVLEHCSNGDLQSFLKCKLQWYLAAHDAKKIPNNEGLPLLVENDFLKLTQIYRIATDICVGMEYLHSQGIIHRDLRTANILLSSDFSAKIAGFASAHKETDELNQFRSHSVVPIKYMAPESIRSSIFTKSTDAWMFAVLLWELLTIGGTPFPTIPTIQMYTVLRKSIRLQQPIACSHQIYGLMRDCWSFEPPHRPRFEEIRRQIVSEATAALSDHMVAVRFIQRPFPTALKYS